MILVSRPHSVRHPMHLFSTNWLYPDLCEHGKRKQCGYHAPQAKVAFGFASLPLQPESTALCMHFFSSHLFLWGKDILKERSKTNKIHHSSHNPENTFKALSFQNWDWGTKTILLPKISKCQEKDDHLSSYKSIFTDGGYQMTDFIFAASRCRADPKHHLTLPDSFIAQPVFNRGWTFEMAAAAHPSRHTALSQTKV